MVKWILTSIIGAGAMATAVPIIGAAADHDNPAERLVSATEYTNRQASDLSGSYTQIVPLTDEEGNFTPQGQGDDATPEPTPDPRYDQYTSESEHEVTAAMAFLNELIAETGPPQQTEYLAAVRQLHAAWQPRYEQAAADYKVFAYRIHHTEEMAQEYFKTQQRLTNSIINDESRRKAELNDQAEIKAFVDWRDQAHVTLLRADRIKQDLDDMNAGIAKLVLSANFAALYQDFQQLPASMLSLHADIAEFQRRSDQIIQQFGPGGSAQ